MTASMPAAKFRKVGVSLTGKHLSALDAFRKARGLPSRSAALQVLIHENARPAPVSAPTAAAASPAPAALPAPAPASPIAEDPAGSPVDGESLPAQIAQ